MRVRFGELAKDEIAQARAYLERQQSGLGRKFAAEISESCDRIARQPLLYPVECGDVRKCVMRRFRYTMRYVDHNIPTVLTQTAEEGGATRVLKLRHSEPEFLERMFSVEDV